jgi:hypothetical protein
VGAKMNLYEMAFNFFIFALLLRLLHYLFWSTGYPVLQSGLAQENKDKENLEEAIEQASMTLEREALSLQQQKGDLANLKLHIKRWKGQLAIKQQACLEENVKLNKQSTEKKRLQIAGYCQNIKACKLSNMLWENKLKIQKNISTDVANGFFEKIIASLGARK